MTPAARERTDAALSATLRDPAYAARLGAAGMLAQAGSAAALAEVIAAQRGQVQDALRIVGLRRAG